MPFSHHSHSGQFCPEHARNSLEQMVQTAIAKKMRMFACTEHMPRHEQDFYPGEFELGLTLERHFENQAEYFHEANRLREKYQNQIQILIGFESEWIRPESLELIGRSLHSHNFDFFVGSVHHVHGIPIDFDHASYLRARELSGGSDEELFADYFDSQFEMLRAVRPPVVGHFDLIRLLSDNPNSPMESIRTVWPKILRNLDAIVSYGGLLELNFSSLRKGLTDPYPQSSICKAFHALDGKFCLSDDSHGVEQVAQDYDKVLPFLRNAGIPSLHFLHRADGIADASLDQRFPYLCVGSVDIAELH